MKYMDVQEEPLGNYSAYPSLNHQFLLTTFDLISSLQVCMECSEKTWGTGGNSFNLVNFFAKESLPLGFCCNNYLGWSPFTAQPGFFWTQTVRLNFSFIGNSWQIKWVIEFELFPNHMSKFRIQDICFIDFFLYN